MEIHSETIQSHCCCPFSSLFSGFKALNIWLHWLWMDSFPSGQYHIQSPLNRPIMNWTTVPLILWLQRQSSMLCHLCAAVSASHMTLRFLGHMFYNHMLALFSAQALEWQSRQSHLGDSKHRRQEVQWRNSHPLSIHYLSEINKSFLWPTRKKLVQHLQAVTQYMSVKQ